MAETLESMSDEVAAQRVAKRLLAEGKEQARLS